METALRIAQKGWHYLFPNVRRFDIVMLLACWMKVLQAVWVGERSVYHHFVGLKKLDATQTLVLVHMPIGCVFTGSVLYVLKSWVLTRHSF